MANEKEALRRLGRKLRSLRSERRLRQEDVAERAGFSSKYVSEIERGLRDPPLTTLLAMAEDGLGVPLASVLEGIGSGEAMAAEASVDYEPLPRGVASLAADLAALPPIRRRRVLGAFRVLIGAPSGSRRKRAS